MRVEIWSDVVCPFCYIGKRKFEKALEDFNKKENIEIVWRSFQLDPTMVAVPGKSIHQYLADRKSVSEEKGREMNDYMAGIAKQVGLQYNFDEVIINNTLDAHRLLHLAKKHGVQNELKEKLFFSYYTLGKDIGNEEVLANIGEDVGLNADEVKAMLKSESYLDEVREDQYMAQQIGVQGVPFFVFNNKYAVSGAQPSDVFLQVLDKVWNEQKTIFEVTASAENCRIDGDCSFTTTIFRNFFLK